MSLIKNLIEPEKKSKKDNKEESDEDEKQTVRPIIKSATDLQRLKIEKLMKNPDKPVQIPDYESLEARRNREIEPPSFVRNVMGSSAGAGSGEFHVYRHLRRKEYARQKCIQIKSLTEQLDHEYQKKLEDNRRIAEEKTAKKRAKRLKKKKHGKKSKKDKTNTQTTQQQNENDTSDESDNEATVERKVDDDSGETVENATHNTPKPNDDEAKEQDSSNDHEHEDLNKID